MQCSNQQKQYSLALHNYHDVNGKLPAPGTKVCSKKPDGTQLAGTTSWAVTLPLLPYIEQQARYDSVMTHQYNGSQTDWNGWDDQPPMKGAISAILCPSDSRSEADSSQTARTNIVVSYADFINGNMDGSGAGNGRSLFVAVKWKSFAACTDGTSNTIAISETCASNDSGSKIAKLSTANGITNVDTDPIGLCLNAVLDTNDRKILVNSWTGGTNSGAAGTYDGQRGATAWWFSPARTAFNTVLPPNSPNCNSYSRDSWGCYSATSNHSGGVNCGLLDGSVRFVSDTVNSTTSGLLAAPKEVTSGKSQFGVWGAMGSADGGESVAL
ncbi:general secretion pathway protein GspG [Planctomycetales bacterium]|nr:general secretion pathway protein GspG [Planctomycetales bacterium]